MIIRLVAEILMGGGALGCLAGWALVRYLDRRVPR